MSGWSGGDGKITALLGLIGVILAAAWWAAGRAHAVVQIVMGVIVALVGVNDMNDFAAIGLYSTTPGRDRLGNRRGDHAAQPHGSFAAGTDVGRRPAKHPRGLGDARSARRLRQSDRVCYGVMPLRRVCRMMRPRQTRS